MAMKRIVRGVVRRGLQPVATKAAISMRVDQDVLDWFKAQGDGYHSWMNSVLRAFRDASVWLCVDSITERFRHATSRQQMAVLIRALRQTASS